MTRPGIEPTDYVQIVDPISINREQLRTTATSLILTTVATHCAHYLKEFRVCIQML
jgi:hypothetical protein